MPITRREFVRGGVAAFTVGFSAPAFISDLARAQGRVQRNLVILYPVSYTHLTLPTNREV